MLGRTGKTQTEVTATGVITTAETVIRNKQGKLYTRWEQIGYTSIYEDSEGKQHLEGPVGQQLVKEIEESK